MSDRRYKSEGYVRPDLDTLIRHIGSDLTLAGLLFEDGETTVIFHLPVSLQKLGSSPVAEYRPTLSEWTAILSASDDPQMQISAENGRVWVKKAAYVISSAVQQRIWARDGFKCMYCARQMGEVTLTVDHFIPLYRGGADNESNYLACCRKCNKLKSERDPEEFCNEQGHDFASLARYLEYYLNS